MKRTAAPPPKRRKAARGVAASWDALAAALGIGSRTLHRDRHAPGAPAGRRISEWRAFLASLESEREARRNPPKTSHELAMDAADLRFAEARARQAEREDALAASQVVTKAQAIAGAAGVRDEFIAAFDSLPDAVVNLLAHLPKEKRAEVHQAIRGAVCTARTRISTRGLGAYTDRSSVADPPMTEPFRRTDSTSPTPPAAPAQPASE